MIKNSWQKMVLVGAMVLLSTTAGAQDIGFSQFYANPLYLNPAFAGTKIAPRVSLSYRSQWPGLASAFTTVSASYDQYFSDLHGGVGAIVLSDRQGDHGLLTNTMFGAMYAFQFQVAHDIYVSAALQASLVNGAINWDETRMRFPDQLDPSGNNGFVYPTQATAPQNQSHIYPDFSVGALAFSSYWYGGVSVGHLLQPDQGFYSEDTVHMKLTVHGGALLNVAEEARRTSSLGLATPVISPNFIYQYQGGLHYFNYGLYLDWEPFMVGLWYRHGSINSDAFIFLAGVEYENIKIGYSYDITVSKLANSTAGAHEVTFGITLPVPEKKKRVRAVKCPSF
ncbi:MAG: PorP/SprF family type IX secretion system membrane protein [Bacteroidales bacterium]|nr:PorP/SprF family type IX secretion system membrane protein [Bacteroidales bacterium]